MLIETHIRRSRDDGIYSKIRIFHWYLKHEISIPGKVWHKISFINGFLFWHWRINKLNKEEKNICWLWQHIFYDQLLLQLIVIIAK